MGRYVIRRLLQFIPTVVGAFFLLHYMVSAGIQLRGNPARAFFGERTPSPEMLAAVKRLFNTDDPCLAQEGNPLHPFNPCLGLFVERMGNVAVGDFGTDYRGRLVTDIFLSAAPVTLRLALIAILTEIGIGVLAGVLAGLRSGGFIDYVVKISTVLAIAIPVFVLGRMVQLSIVPFARWLRDNGASDDVMGLVAVTYKLDYPWLSLVIPGIVLGVLGLATTARLTRTSLMENLRADYVRTATAKGMPQRRVIGVHTLRNSLIPVVTNLGYSFGVLLGGAVVTESIFNVPGIGGVVIRSVRFNEGPVVVSMVTILVIVYLVVNLIVDMLYAVLDPRIRYD
ncbi:MAG: ABC transporter permease subunit [Micromonosporaceae bacterium]|nr:ABC transporter permease subunit [Micromonosporaceae bacterium]